MTDWTEFPGPKEYRPDDVERSLSRLAAAASESAARDACNNVLFAIGNNHRGSLYPAAVGAAPRVLELALREKGWVRYAAFEVLVELISFGPEAGFERFTGANGDSVETMAAITEVLRDARRSFLGVVADDAEMELVRVDALTVLDLIDDRVDDLATVLLAMPERSAHGTFDGHRRRFLVERGYL